MWVGEFEFPLTGRWEIQVRNFYGSLKPPKGNPALDYLEPDSGFARREVHVSSNGITDRSEVSPEALCTADDSRSFGFLAALAGLGLGLGVAALSIFKRWKTHQKLAATR